MLAGIIATPSRAQPVDFVKICSLYGAGFFYIPGTDTCTQAQQIVDNQFAIAKAQTLVVGSMIRVLPPPQPPCRPM
jgi:hypothetical protein